jgi:hypothetical protein
LTSAALVGANIIVGDGGRISQTQNFSNSGLAADYQEDEYLLLGIAIKYAGLRGKEVQVIGRDRGTLGEDGTIVVAKQRG